MRGVNVGRAKRIAMSDLSALFESLGFTAVRTLLNSGNVVCTAPAGAKPADSKRIEEAIETELLVTARVTLLTLAELDAIVADNPLCKIAKDPSRLMVTVLRTPADRKHLDVLMVRDWSPDVAAVGGRAAYLWCPRGILESKLGATLLGPTFRDLVTTRNWATIQKLHALAHAET